MVLIREIQLPSLNANFTGDPNTLSPPRIFIQSHLVQPSFSSCPVQLSHHQEQQSIKVGEKTYLNIHRLGFPPHSSLWFLLIYAKLNIISFINFERVIINKDDLLKENYCNWLSRYKNDIFYTVFPEIQS